MISPFPRPQRPLDDSTLYVIALALLFSTISVLAVIAVCLVGFAS